MQHTAGERASANRALTSSLTGRPASASLTRGPSFRSLPTAGRCHASVYTSPRQLSDSDSAEPARSGEQDGPEGNPLDQQMPVPAPAGLDVQGERHGESPVSAEETRSRWQLEPGRLNRRGSQPDDDAKMDRHEAIAASSLDQAPPAPSPATATELNQAVKQLARIDRGGSLAGISSTLHSSPPREAERSNMLESLGNEVLTIMRIQEVHSSLKWLQHAAQLLGIALSPSDASSKEAALSKIKKVLAQQLDSVVSGGVSRSNWHSCFQPQPAGCLPGSTGSSGSHAPSLIACLAGIHTCCIICM